MTKADRASWLEGESWRGRVLSRVRSIGAVRYRVELEGPLRPGWMTSLGLELAERDLSIERAVAKRDGGGLWSAEVDIVQTVSSAPGNHPLHLPYAHLAEQSRRAASSEPFVLTSYTIIDSPLHGGCVELSFEAEDSLGLLGRVLSELALLVLFPVEFSIQTTNGRVHDTLWLGGIRAATPSAEARRRLNQRLSRFT